MKKVFSIAAVAAFTMFAASCGDAEAEAKRVADSTRVADSLAQVHADWVADSTHNADSVKAANDAMEAQRIADSTRVADSLAKLGNKSKPKAPKAPSTEPKVKPGGRPGANK